MQVILHTFLGETTQRSMERFSKMFGLGGETALQAIMERAITVVLATQSCALAKT
jgi:hypothetical protein